MALEETGVKLVTQGESQFLSSMQKAQAAAVAFGEGIYDIGKKGVAYLQQGINKFVDYSEKVRDLGRISGGTAEQTSKLIQVSDDLKVEYSTLEQAAKALAQDGIALTTEEIAKASDEYLKFKDQNERTEYAVKKFGRAGLEMTKVLEMGGDALRKMSDAQEGNLILTQEALDTARKYEIVQDDLNDTVDGMWVALGQKVIPAFTDFIRLMKEGIDVGTRLVNWNDDINKALSEHEKWVKKSYTNWRDYIVEMMRAHLAANGVKISTEALNEQIIEQGIDLDTVAIGLGLQSRLNWDNVKSQEASAEAYAKNSEQIKNYSFASQGAMEQTDAFYISLDKDTAAIKANDAAMKTLVTEAMKPLTAELLNQKIMATLSGDTLLIYARDMGYLNETSFKTLTTLSDLTKKYDTNRNGVIDLDEATNEYWAALEAVKNKMQEIDGTDALITLRADFSDWERALQVADRLLAAARAGGNWTPGTPFNPNPTPTPNPVPTPKPKVTDPWGDMGNNGKRASGGSVWANHPYFVGERGPELFMPKVNGEIISNRSIAAALAQSGGMVSGPSISNTSNYNLSVMTNNNSAAVLQSFNLMKMLAG